MTNTDVETTQRQLEANTPSADLSQGGVIATDVPRLIASHDPNLNIQPAIDTNPYIIYNCQSPNNGGALKQVAVRQALSDAINRADITQVMGGPKLAPPLTHVLPPEIEGSQPYDPYPYNPTKAKSLLTQAGVKNMKLTFLYRPSSPTQIKIFQTVQNALGKVGITVKGLQASDADFYTKYLENPKEAQQGVWDLSLAGWLPDWYGNAALSFFGPLFDGRQLPPSSSNFGLFNDSKVNSLIDQAKAATSESQSTALWAQADKATMDAAAFFPLSDQNAADYHASQVHNDIYMAPFGSWDWTNVWLDQNKSGG